MCTCNWFLIVFCIQPDTGALAFWLFASWGMSSRPNSSNTLLEGMQDVQFGPPNPTADRKRELQMQIEAPKTVMLYALMLLL